GSHAVTAEYGGNATNVSSTSEALSYAVIRVGTNIAIAGPASDSTIDDTVTFRATVMNVGGSTPTGTVDFTDVTDSNKSLGLSTLNGGIATFPISSLAVGSHTITATYGGDSNNNGSISYA